jgi:hypothetical protein
VPRKMPRDEPLEHLHRATNAWCACQSCVGGEQRPCGGHLGQRDVRRVVRGQVAAKCPHAWSQPVGGIARDRELCEPGHGDDGLVVCERAAEHEASQDMGDHLTVEQMRGRKVLDPRADRDQAPRRRARRSRRRRERSIAPPVAQLRQDQVAVDASADLLLGPPHHRRVVAHSLRSPGQPMGADCTHPIGRSGATRVLRRPAPGCSRRARGRHLFGDTRRR